MKEYFDSLLNTINSSINNLDIDRFEELSNESANILRSGNKVIVTGLGKNVPICEKFVGTMLSFGLNATFMHTNTAVHGDLGAVHDGDLVIILSKSGETAESLYLLDQLKKRRVSIWCITFSAESSLARNVMKALVVKMDHEGDKWDIVPNNSTTLYLIILQALAIELANKMEITLEDFKMNHPGGAIGAKLNGKG